MKAIGAYVVIKHTLNDETKSGSGIVLSVKEETASKCGVVVSVGALAQDIGIKEGDKIWFTAYDLKFDEDIGEGKLLGIKISNIVAVE